MPVKFKGAGNNQGDYIVTIDGTQENVTVDSASMRSMLQNNGTAKSIFTMLGEKPYARLWNYIYPTQAPLNPYTNQVIQLSSEDPGYDLAELLYKAHAPKYTLNPIVKRPIPSSTTSDPTIGKTGQVKQPDSPPAPSTAQPDSLIDHVETKVSSLINSIPFFKSYPTLAYGLIIVGLGGLGYAGYELFTKYEE